MAISILTETFPSHLVEIESLEVGGGRSPSDNPATWCIPLLVESRELSLEICLIAFSQVIRLLV